VDCWRSAPAIRLVSRRPSGPKRSQEAPGRDNKNTGDFQVTSISFLPTTFTTLFVLAASLLLGYI
jgi:hypothetical protein